MKCRREIFHAIIFKSKFKQVRDHKMSARKSVRKPWDAEEDTMLLHLINKYGSSGCWPKIAVEMESRTGKQCRERYINHLDPDMKKSEWTCEEDNIIRNLYPELGSKWSQYMTALVGRSDNAIKNRFHVISRGNFDTHSKMSASNSHTNKRSITEVTAGDATDIDTHIDTHVEPIVPDKDRKRLKRLHHARDLLDRKIREVEERTNNFLSSHPSPSDLSTHFDSDLVSELGSDFELDFDWTDVDSFLSGSESSDHSIVGGSNLLDTPFDFDACTGNQVVA